MANPSNRASDARPRNATPRSLPLRLALCTAPAASAWHGVPRNVHSKPTSTNPRIPCACYGFVTPHTSTCAHTHDFSHRATQSSGFSCRARFPTCTIPHACHAKPRARGPADHHSPHLPRETHAARRPSAQFPTTATRIRRPAPSQAPTCIRSPTPATRSAHPLCSPPHTPRPPTPAMRNTNPRPSDKPTLPRFPTPAPRETATRYSRQNIFPPLIPTAQRLEDTRECSRTLAHAPTPWRTQPPCTRKRPQRLCPLEGGWEGLVANRVYR